MNLYLVYRSFGVVNPGELDSIVVAAEDDGRARELAAKHHGGECPDLWLTSAALVKLLDPCTTDAYRNAVVCRNIRS